MKKFFLIFLFLPVICFAQIITPIANIQDSISVYNGQDVTIQGIVTIGVGVTHNQRCNVFIQDESNRGIMIFDYDITSAFQQDLVRGNELKVTGEVEEFSGITEIKDFNYEVVSTGNPEPTPVLIELNQYLNGYEGTLVRVVGEVFDPYYAGGGWNINVRDQMEGETIIRVWDSTDIDVSLFVEGFILEAVGVGSLYNSDFQILPGYQDQLRAGEFDIYPYGDISEPQSGFPTEITFAYPGEFESVLLYWKTIEDLEFELLEMQPDLDRDLIYSADVPAQSAGTKVEFYITTTDTVNDTVAIVTTYPIGYPVTEPPFDYIIPVNKTKAVLNVPPKPFNPYIGETFPIEFASREGDKAILRIYNAEGKLVFQPKNITISGNSGNNLYPWDGRDKDGKLVPIGLYICYLEVVTPSSGNKKSAKAPIVVGVPLK